MKRETKVKNPEMVRTMEKIAELCGSEKKITATGWIHLSEMDVGDLAIYDDNVVILTHTIQDGGYDFLGFVCDVRHTIELYRDHPDVNISDIPELIIDIDVDDIDGDSGTFRM